MLDDRLYLLLTKLHVHLPTVVSQMRSTHTLIVYLSDCDDGGGHTILLDSLKHKAKGVEGLEQGMLCPIKYNIYSLDILATKTMFRIRLLGQCSGPI